MPAYLCRVRYSVQLGQTNLKGYDPGSCIGEAEELREPDAWGDPGPLVSRRWVRVVGTRDGRDYVRELARGYYQLRRGMEQVGPLVWDGFEGGETGA